ncbi:MAG: NADH-quinone oxidoreductase subunit C [Candidatus Accumulibacter sp.]|nr:NADH-quinone oxidoreductase subunit C [Accumulibacter sp.]
MPRVAESLVQSLRDEFGERVSARVCLDGASIDVAASDYLEVMERLRDAPSFRFEQLIDVCGIDYSAYGKTPWPGRRFAVIVHLLSVSKNRRVRVRCFVPDDAFPSIPSISSIWNSADWFEREAFDLFGIVFTGHANLRRILTDYGFDGHPLRKDFPVSGKVEVRYDAELARVVSDPVSIAPRVITPRVFPE